MPLLSPNDGVTPDGGVENIAFEILMESVLKMSKLMNVSVFLLVEQNCGRKRRYGGSPELCDAFNKGKLRANHGGESEDVQLTVEEEEKPEEEEEENEEEEDESDNDGRETSTPLPQSLSNDVIAEENYEIVETVETFVGETARSPETDYVDSDFVGDAEGFADEEDDSDSDSDWSNENRGKRKSGAASRKKLQARYRRHPQLTKSAPISLSSSAKQKQSPPQRQSPPQKQQLQREPQHRKQSLQQGRYLQHQSQHQSLPLEEDSIAQQIRDYAEGRGDYEGSSDSWATTLRVESVCVLEEPNQYEAAVKDAGANDDTSEDDDWKPVNYGRGKIYQREKKKYHRKELKKKRRQGLSSEGDVDVEPSESPRAVANIKATDSGNCPHCHKYFHKLKQHIHEVHESDRKYSCEYCASRFKRDEHLKKHLRGVHKVSAL